MTGVEYADEQITVYGSCLFGCKYCWANTPLFNYRRGRGAEKYLEKAEKLARATKPKKIVVSFTADPYQPRERHEVKTRKVLEILAKSKVEHEVMVLTKNPQLAVERDSNLFVENGFWLGTTVTALSYNRDEVLAPPNPERVFWLKMAHKMGIKTWMSIEPWIPDITDPEEIIRKTHGFVDYYVVGRLNYEKTVGYPVVEDTFYAEKLVEVIDLLDRLGKEYHIKKELAKCLEKKGV